MRKSRRSQPFLFDVRAGEWPKVIGMGTLFFLAISTFWVVKPIKRGVLLGFYGHRKLELLGRIFTAAEAEQLGKILNLGAAMAAVIVFTLMVRRLRRDQLVVSICTVFVISFIAFGASVGRPTAPLVWSLYVFGDTYNTIMLGMLWAVMNDLVRKDQAKRLYGLIGLGGVIGGFVGATVVRQYVEALGRAPLLYLCVVPVALVALITVWMHRDLVGRGYHRGERLPATSGSSAALEGARLVSKSRYLIGIATLIVLYEVVSNIVDFQLSAAVQQFIRDGPERDAFFGLLGQATGILSIGVQLFVTTWVLRKWGVATALLFLPVAIFFGSAGFLALPTLALAAFMSASDNGMNYSINQSAKEALYVPTTRDEKYKAKAFIDMFVQRTAKVGAIGLNLSVSAIVGIEGVRWLSIPTMALLAVWVVVVWRLGRSFETRVNHSPHSDRGAS